MLQRSRRDGYRDIRPGRVGYFVRERLGVHDQQHAADVPDADRHADPDADGHAVPDADRHADPDADGHAVPDADRHAVPDADRHAVPDADRHAVPDADIHNDRYRNAGP